MGRKLRKPKHSPQPTGQERFTFEEKPRERVIIMQDAQRQETFYLTHDQVRALAAYWMRQMGEILI